MTVERAILGKEASSIWTIRSGSRTYRIRSCSARAALEHAEQFGFKPAIIVGLEERARRPRAETRHSRKKEAILPEVLRRVEARETMAAIARAVKMPRETVRDWVRAAEVSDL